MRTVPGNFCGSDRDAERRIDYLYRGRPRPERSLGRRVLDSQSPHRCPVPPSLYSARSGRQE
jgi:hypothetical protein